MPTLEKYTITYTDSGFSPSPLECDAGDKITWTNSSSVNGTLTLPTCVSPHGGDVIDFNAHSSEGPKTVNSNSKGSFDYSINTPSAGVSSGTIDVES